MNYAEHGLAAQLMAAKLNVAAGARSCTAAADPIAGGDALLGAIRWNGAAGSRVVGRSHAMRTDFVQVAGNLDRYNNGLVC